MRIVYLGAFRLPDGDAAAARVLGVAKTIKSTGNHEVIFISMGGRYRECDLCSDGKYRVAGFEYYVSDEIDASGSLLQRAFKYLARGKRTLAILKRLKAPDAIIMYNPDYRLVIRIKRFVRHSNIRLICDLTEWYASSELKLFDVLPYFYTMEHLIKSIHNKICISSFFYKYYSNSNNVLIPATIDLSDNKWHNLVDLNIPPFDGVTLIYAGTPARKDLLKSIVSCVSGISDRGVDIRLLIVGSTKENYEKTFGPLASEVSHIVFCGRQPQELIPSYYALADYMVLLRPDNRKSNAGFPTKLTEALASGCPVIANATSDITKYVKDGYNGFIVENFDESALSKVLLKVISLGKDDVEVIRRNARESAKNLDYRAFSNSVSSFLRELR